MQLAKAMDSLEGIEALRTFDAILVGGAATHPQLLDSAKKLRINIVTTYGSSETSGGCVYNGRPLDRALVRIGDEGRIYLGGPMIAQGYRNVDSDAFMVDESGTSWFATSDAGALHDGHLTVTGRLDNILNTGGLKLHPEQLEQHILRVPGVDGVCVVGIPHPRLGQMIVAAYTGWADVGDILVALDDSGLPRWQIPKDFKRLAQLPTTGPGKVDRLAVARMWDS